MLWVWEMNCLWLWTICLCDQLVSWQCRTWAVLAIWQLWRIHLENIKIFLIKGDIYHAVSAPVNSLETTTKKTPRSAWNNTNGMYTSIKIFIYWLEFANFFALLSENVAPNIHYIILHWVFIIIAVLLSRIKTQGIFHIPWNSAHFQLHPPPVFFMFVERKNSLPFNINVQQKFTLPHQDSKNGKERKRN